MWSKKLSVGCEVSYSDVNQWRRRGTLIRFAKGQHGGDCVVLWEGRQGVYSEECSFNLISWERGAA
jgi:hypothetical protein